MRRCAFLTLDAPAGYIMDDALAAGALGELGWRVEFVPWARPGVRWNEYDAVVIRSTWDYHEAPQEFINVLNGIVLTGAHLMNGLHLVEWNVRKTYLRDLAERGIPVVPTLWRERLEPGGLRELMAAAGTAEAIVKPVIGASAGGVYRIDERTALGQAGAIEAYYADRALMVQPFVPAVMSEGEFSLIYFNGEYSHAILKTPIATDFRVQEEHGGRVRPVQPGAALRRAGDLAIGALDEAPLYARADLVRSPDGGGYWLMELELIEPALYFRTDRGAPRRFARALHSRNSIRRPGRQ